MATLADALWTVLSWVRARARHEGDARPPILTWMDGEVGHAVLLVADTAARAIAGSMSAVTSAEIPSPWCVSAEVESRSALRPRVRPRESRAALHARGARGANEHIAPHGPRSPHSRSTAGTDARSAQASSAERRAASGERRAPSAERRAPRITRRRGSPDAEDHQAPKKAEGPIFRSGPQNPGSVLLSHRVAPAVPLALKSLTSVFGMGTGVTSSV